MDWALQYWFTEDDLKFDKVFEHKGSLREHEFRLWLPTAKIKVLWLSTKPSYFLVTSQPASFLAANLFQDHISSLEVFDQLIPEQKATCIALDFSDSNDDVKTEKVRTNKSSPDGDVHPMGSQSIQKITLKKRIRDFGRN